jgi:hypothetical protein
MSHSKTGRKTLSTIITFFIFSTAFAQQSKIMMSDSVNTFDAIFFNKEVYTLTWSHFAKGYYKQEYLRTKDDTSAFNKMITFDVLLTDLATPDLIAKKINEIEARKGKDPVANYQVIENEQTGEYLLDFLISEGDLYEWNAYRYKTINTNKGKAILLFAYSLRSFKGAELKANDFFAFLKQKRQATIELLASYNLPSIVLKD